MPNMAEKMGFGPKRVETELEKGYWRIDVTPPAFTGLQTRSVTLSAEQMKGYRRWRAGEPIQNALPTLRPSLREILMSGIGDEDWNRMFSDDQDS